MRVSQSGQPSTSALRAGLSEMEEELKEAAWNNGQFGKVAWASAAGVPDTLPFFDASLCLWRVRPPFSLRLSESQVSELDPSKTAG